MKDEKSKNKTGRYFPQEIEAKWQEKWASDKLYEADLLDNSREKYYTLVELPYPSGDLHLGHWFAFVPPDAHARFQRMKGKNVLFPNGFDAFGLPAENAAIKHNIHPKDWTMKNIETMKKQFSTMGTMIDWTHTAITCEPDYYRWNQWIFLEMYEKGIAYRGKTLSNWCPKDQTVLANEHIENGKCWRCGEVVEQKEVEQWFLKITSFADDLIWENTDEKVSNGVEWPKSVREAQNNWIGRSEGLIFTAPVKDSDLKIQTFSAHFEAFTADTFVVIAPDHPLLDKLIYDVPNKKEIKDFCRKIIESRMKGKHDEAKTLEGIFTGKYVEDPVGNGDLPIWVASFALRDYGTGIVKCSAHDERDFAFAKKYGIRLKPVLFPQDPELRKKVENLEVCYTDMKNGILAEPSVFAGKRAGDIRQEIVKYVQEKKLAVPKTSYHLRDWSISRQRYWGTPVPIIHCEKDGMVAVAEEQLPVELPYEVDFTPTGKPPLATAQDWLNVKCPKCGGEAKRDAETLDTFFDSAWYYYRYVSPGYNASPFDTDLVNKVMPVSVYFGGGEHTLGHTLYARFFTKFFKELGLVDFDEFSLKRIQHGVILGPDGNRMSKSKGNVVNPDDIVKEFGTDTVRVYLCFMMPYIATTAPWSPGAISGIYRFLKRVWEMQSKVESENSKVEMTREDEYQLNKTIKKVGEDLENIHFNTAVSSLMEWLNYLSAKKEISLEEYETFLKLLAPFAPHITEEIWQTLHSGATSLHKEAWPEFEKSKIFSEKINIAVQINGKLRGTVEIEANDTNNQPQIEEKAKADHNISNHLKDKEIKKIIYVPGKILNFVI